MNVAVIGLGYIGLPTAAVFAQSGHQVYGYDANAQVRRSLQEGVVTIGEPAVREEVEAALLGCRLQIVDVVPRADAYVLCVPTPTLEGKPDLSYVENAAGMVAAMAEPGAIVVLESTVPPGTTERILRRALMSQGKAIDDFHVAHCPERVIPGAIMKELRTNARVVGGRTPADGAIVRKLYASFCEGDIAVTSTAVAEFVKVIENTFRDVNIAFANELAIVAEELGIDAWESIAIANRHPRVQILSPGPGVGGHCIPVDPHFLADASPFATELIQSARRVNERMPDRIARRVAELVEPAAGTKGRVAGCGLQSGRRRCARESDDSHRCAPTRARLRDVDLRSARDQLSASVVRVGRRGGVGRVRSRAGHRAHGLSIVAPGRDRGDHAGAAPGRHAAVLRYGGMGTRRLRVLRARPSLQARRGEGGGVNTLLARIGEPGAGPYFIDWDPAQGTHDGIQVKARLDPQGVLIHRGVSDVYHPIWIAQFALRRLGRWCSAGDRDARENFLDQAAWLRDHQQRRGIVGLYRFEIPWNKYGAREGWWSATAQGLAISVLLRAERLEPGCGYGDAAVRAALPFRYDIAHGGVVWRGGDDLFFEEVANKHAVHVLGGCICALWGLWELQGRGGDAWHAALVQECVGTLRRWLPSFDTGWWTLASRLRSANGNPDLATPRCHERHVAQMLVLAKMFDDTVFATAAERWASYGATRECRRRFVASTLRALPERVLGRDTIAGGAHT